MVTLIAAAEFGLIVALVCGLTAALVYYGLLALGVAVARGLRS